MAKVWQGSAVRAWHETCTDRPEIQARRIPAVRRSGVGSTGHEARRRIPAVQEKTKESTGHEAKRRIPAVRAEKEERKHRARSQAADTCGARSKRRKKAQGTKSSGGYLRCEMKKKKERTGHEVKRRIPAV